VCDVNDTAAAAAAAAAATAAAALLRISVLGEMHAR
jgi:hypothetical protein